MTISTNVRASVPTVTTTAATAIVVADMVGVGVFTSLGFQVKDITSGFALMVLWLVGGVVALCGAFCYAELSGMFPRSSGEYNFLARAYHPVLGFLAGWLSATVGFSAPVAIAAIAFGEYARSILPDVDPLVLGLLLIWSVSAVHLAGTRHGSAFQIAATLLKLALIVGFIVAGILTGGVPAGGGPAISFMPSAADPALILSAPFAISLVFVMYSYSGWNAATYIIGELRDPQRSVPRALFVGTSIVAALYVALNAVFLYTTPISALAGKVDVAIIAGGFIFGPRGGALVGALICVGLVSTVSAMVWIGPRVTMAMGEDVPLLRMFSRRSRHGVPATAIVFQASVASLLLFTRSFEAVLDFSAFSLSACSLLTVAGVIKLRITHPDAPRPYRAWGYPATPLIFCAVTLFVLSYLAANRPMQSLAGLALVLAGLGIYGLASLRPIRPPTGAVP